MGSFVTTWSGSRRSAHTVACATTGAFVCAVSVLRRLVARAAPSVCPRRRVECIRHVLSPLLPRSYFLRFAAAMVGLQIMGGRHHCTLKFPLPHGDSLWTPALFVCSVCGCSEGVQEVTQRL